MSLTWVRMKNQCQKRKNMNPQQRAKQSRRQNSETIFWTLLGWSPEMPALVSSVCHISLRRICAGTSYSDAKLTRRCLLTQSTWLRTNWSNCRHRRCYPRKLFGPLWASFRYVGVYAVICMHVCAYSIASFLPFYLLAWTGRLLQNVKNLNLSLILQGCVREDASSFIAAQNPVSIVLESPCKACICLPSMGRREETVSQYIAKVLRVKDVWGVRKSRHKLPAFARLWAEVSCFCLLFRFASGVCKLMARTTFVFSCRWLSWAC
jgi:hypothetical protein